jgi:hypothetical protein
MYNIKNSIQKLLNRINKLKPMFNGLRVKVWRGTYEILKPLSLDLNRDPNNKPQVYIPAALVEASQWTVIACPHQKLQLMDYQ